MDFDNPVHCVLLLACCTIIPAIISIVWTAIDHNNTLKWLEEDDVPESRF